jgi:hypothetical protein
MALVLEGAIADFAESVETKIPLPASLLRSSDAPIHSAVDEERRPTIRPQALLLP